MSDTDLVIHPIADGEEAAVAALWTACNLTVSYNDPIADIARCRRSPPPSCSSARGTAGSSPR